MKIVCGDFIGDGPGSGEMVPGEADDLWLAYNLISEGDSVLAVTVRNSDIPTRKRYVNLVDSVKNSGGTSHISSMHVSGEHLAQLTGIAAMLGFPLPESEEIEM